MVSSRSLLDIDQIEARAIKTRTACTSIYELSEMMKSMAKEGTTDKFMTILGASLVTSKRAVEVQQTLQAIADFEDKLHFESYSNVFDLEKLNLNKQNKQPHNEIAKNA